MSGSRIREFVYRYAITLSAVLAVIIVISLHLLSSIPSKMADKPSLVTISITLAGFLFTGQGIMLALPGNSRFMQLVREHGYLDDFHHLCRWAEMAFIGSVVMSLEVITNLFSDPVLANLLYLISFIWPLIMAFWALWIFGNVIGMLNK